MAKLFKTYLYNCNNFGGVKSHLISMLIISILEVSRASFLEGMGYLLEQWHLLGILW